MFVLRSQKCLESCRSARKRGGGRRERHYIERQTLYVTVDEWKTHCTNLAERLGVGDITGSPALPAGQLWEHTL